MIGRISKVIKLALAIIVFCLFILPLNADQAEDQQMLTGYTTVVRSIDCYLRGVYNFELLYGENTETNGDLSMCNNVIFAQYPSRIDGYLRFYDRTGSVEYQKLGEQIIEKLFKVYSLTKDKDGKNWIPLQAAVTRTGELYGYSKGKSFNRLSNEKRHPVSFDQSNGIYLIEKASMLDAFGVGSWELARLITRKDNSGEKDKVILKDEYREKYIKILECIMDFFHRDYMLYKKGDVFYYRTDDVVPSAPSMPIPKPNWNNEASDVIYVALALQELGVDTGKWDFPLSMFLKYYLSERRDHSEESRINFLDNRILDLCEYFKKKNKEEATIKEIYGMLKYTYEKKGTTKALFMLDGATKNPSSIPTLDIYRKLGLKWKYQELFKDIWENSFNEEKGIVEPNLVIIGGNPVSVNCAGYHALLSYSYTGWKDGMISDVDFIKAYKKYYKFKGNPLAYKDLDDWVIETPEADRERPGWTATPTDFFAEECESEQYYGGEAQAYSLNRIRVGEDKKIRKIKENTGKAKTKEDQLTLSKNIKEYMDVNRVRKGEYRQFVSVFPTHGEPIRYGEALTFNLIDTRDKITYDKENNKINVKLGFKDIPNGLPCFGVIDVSTYAPSDQNNEVKKVLYGDKEVLFKVSKLLDYPEIFKETKSVKVIFLVEYAGEKNGNLEVILGKKEIVEQLKYKEVDKNKTEFIKTPVDSKEISRLIDKLQKTNSRYFPFTLYSRWQDKLINQEYRKSAKLVESVTKGEVIISNEELVLNKWKNFKMSAEFNRDSAELSTWLKALNKYLEETKSEIKSKNIAERIEKLTEINENLRSIDTYTKETQTKVSQRLLQDMEYLLQNLPKENSSEKLKEIVTALKFMVVYPELSVSMKNVDIMWDNLRRILSDRMNEDGLVKDDGSYETVKELTVLIRLCWQNKISVSKEVAEITKKLAKNLMYLMDGEGCLSQIGNDTERVNLRQYYYWLGKIFDRSDFRFIAYGGMKMPDSIAPKKTTKSFPNSGYVAMRNSWDIADSLEFAKYRRENQEKNSKKDSLYINDRMKMLSYNLNTGKFEIYSNGEIQFKYMGNEDLRKGEIAKFESNKDYDFLRVEKNGNEKVYQRIWFFKKYGIWFIDTTLTNSEKPLESIFEFYNCELSQEKKEERQLTYTMHNFNSFKRIPQNLFHSRDQGEVVFEMSGSGRTRMEKEEEDRNGIEYTKIRYLQKSPDLINWQMVVTAFSGGRGQIGELSGSIAENGRTAVSKLTRDWVEKGLPNVSSKLYNNKVELFSGNEIFITINLENEKIQIKGIGEESKNEKN
ncbi:MAG: hypothetical protein A2231_10580 [Candidatus Firestonebacteria bacterium RIFOXYA2_FULL_40_8]|nr:MAG: hypothetical protein A2231_10580 [Candidatus Firestonebacteria bacterium RIFOXYA2_FULL_40_8]